MIGKYIQNPLKKLNTGDSWLVGGELGFFFWVWQKNTVNSVGIPTSIQAKCDSSCASELKSKEGRTLSIGIAALCVRMISTFSLIHADVNPSGSQWCRGNDWVTTAKEKLGEGATDCMSSGANGSPHPKKQGKPSLWRLVMESLGVVLGLKRIEAWVRFIGM